MTEPVLSLTGVLKRFGATLANDDVDFSVVAGEIHALMGENGAGKTTLMNIASGLYAPDGGSISLSGEVQNWSNPTDALAAGVSMVHQSYMLIDNMTVAENVVLGTTSGLGRISIPGLARDVAEIAATHGLSLSDDPRDTDSSWAHRRARDLSPAEKQRVAIVSALYRQSRVLILDEPTSVLSPLQIDQLFTALRRLRDSGLAIVFISHKIREVMQLCDRVTVMRSGRVIGSAAVGAVTEGSLASWMVGGNVETVQRTPRRLPEDTALAVDGVWVKGERAEWAVKDASLTLRQGEVLGLAGVEGSGQHELVEALAGVRDIERGTIRFGAGEELPPTGVRGRVSHVPLDPRRRGLILNTTAAWNVGIRHHDEPGGRFGRWSIDHRRFADLAKGIIDRFDVRNCHPATRVADLSGGNMQKLLLGRELELGREVALIVNPTSGLDVGAIQFIRRAILKSAERGASVLLVSNELEELLALSDRIGVFFEGSMVGELEGPRATRANIGRLMSGLALQEAR